MGLWLGRGRILTFGTPLDLSLVRSPLLGL
jgi:hypothetical protein